MSGDQIVEDRSCDWSNIQQHARPRKTISMPADADAILSAALNLPEDVRLSLACKLLDSLPPEGTILSEDDPGLPEGLI
ncbi:MAG: hypothetical protein KJZ87_06595 [Thermoguttaceae bacterium]|nr:hypothetical protein [Thermoguttaceae bacterium]